MSAQSFALPVACYASDDRLRTSPAALAAVVAVHLALFAALWLRPASEPVTPPKPLTVSLIAPEPEAPPEPPKPEPPPPEPQPVLKQPPPVLAAKPTPAPTPAPPVEAPKPLPMPVPEVLPPPVPPKPVVEAPRPAAPPAPPTPPRPADYLSNPEPPYPALSKRLGEEGTVKLRVWVNEDGTPGKIEVFASSGSTRLDNAALAVLPRWKFAPAQKGGKAIADWVIVPMEFTLTKG